MFFFIIQSAQSGEVTPIDRAVKLLEERKENIRSNKNIIESRKQALLLSAERKQKEFLKMKEISKN